MRDQFDCPQESSVAKTAAEQARRELKKLETFFRKSIKDNQALTLIDMIIDSFKTKEIPEGAIGIPLGNVTSQFFANLYLHELDDFIKQNLREKYYLRYCDDFIILANNEIHLRDLILRIQEFLRSHLRLELHPKKLIIKKITQGIDFVGSILFEKHVITRTRTKQRMKHRLKEAYENYLIGKIDAKPMDQKLQSYLGILSHANQYTLINALKNAYWVRE
ncbi:MAG TPA: RNA-directed DNA polymerase [Chlamydiales bacterium]|nr:RNA-directed DNA polymerase [Chlamydiales bacterium]